MLSNINADKDQPLQLMLVGQPQLRNLLRSPQLLQFAQRISSDFHLTPLAHDEVMQYIDFRLQAVGARYHLFTEEACAVIADASRGIPRLINILCDTALVYGFCRTVRLHHGRTRAFGHRPQDKIRVCSARRPAPVKQRGATQRSR